MSTTRTVQAPFPIDLARTVGPLRTGRHDPTILLSRTAVLQAMRTPDGPATLRATAEESTRFQVEAWGPGAAWALEQAPGYLGCLDDTGDFEPHHPVVTRLQQRLPGIRLPRTGRVVEALIPTIMGQRVTGFEANRSFRLLVEQWGEPAPGPGGLTLLPTVEVITGLGYYELHVIGMERKRADTLQRIAAHAGQLEAAATDGDALQQQLEGITGVSAWTQAEVRRVVLGDPDVVSVGDHHMKHVVSWALAQEPRGTDARMLELLAPYAGHRGRVCVLLAAGGVQAPRRPSVSRPSAQPRSG